MSTCCPEFRAALRHARGTVRHLQLQHFEGYATAADVSEARAALFALEGAPDPLQTPPLSREYHRQLRLAALRRAARKATTA